MEDKKTDRKRCSTSMYCYNQQSILSLPSFSFTLLHPAGPSPASVSYLYPITQHPLGGFMTLSAGKRVMFTGKYGRLSSES